MNLIWLTLKKCAIKIFYILEFLVDSLIVEIIFYLIIWAWGFNVTNEYRLNKKMSDKVFFNQPDGQDREEIRNHCKFWINFYLISDFNLLGV